MIQKIRSKQAVSEVIGVVLLLGMAISLFALLNFYVFSNPFDPSVTSVNLIGTMDRINNVINIEHVGGESLEGNINIKIIIGSQLYQNTSSELLLDVNADNKWNFGEIVRFHSPESVTNKYVRVEVTDPAINSIILSVTLQQELS